MAFWGDRDGFVDKDLMSVPGDTLFADPLGVRPSSRNQVPNRSQAPHGAASQSQNRERREREEAYSRVRDEEMRYTPGMSPKASDGSKGVRRQEEEEEEGQWGPLGSLLWYVMAGGKQCCTMRTKPQDPGGAKRASEEGRPPEFARSQNSRFPDPFVSENAFEGHGRRDAEKPFDGRGFGREGNRDRTGGHGDDHSYSGGNRDDRDRGLGRGTAGGRGFDTGSDRGRGLGGGDGGRGLGGDDRGRGLGGDDRARGFGGDDRGRGLGGDDRGRGFGGDDRGRGLGGDDRGRGLGGDDRGRGLGGLGREADYGLGRAQDFSSGVAGGRGGAEKEAAKPQERVKPEERLDETVTVKRDAKKETKPDTRQAERPSIPAPTGIKPSDPKKEKGAELPKQWSWPAWCLNFKSPCIEVYVVDEDTGIGRWVEGEPQSRVVDNAGKDAYLCVEYEWDGEFYVQDFGPQHIRRRGQTKPVAELLG